MIIQFLEIHEEVFRGLNLKHKLPYTVHRIGLKLIFAESEGLVPAVFRLTEKASETRLNV